ncbi:MAG: SPOR domain-containing protein, partial [Desulfobacterota bacterium]|nr:SPOR domain-containing protein [Thermodesulfobacteriota bacterium]
IYLRNHNKLLGRFEGMLGGKTGYTRRAGKCFVGEARRDKKELLVSVLGSKNHFRDVAILLNYGFNKNKILEVVQFPKSNSGSSASSLTCPRNYVLQVASFSNVIKAKELKQLLTDNGYPSFIETVTLKSGITFHRVKIGFYPDLSSAQKTKSNIWEYFGLNPLILHQEADTP